VLESLELETSNPAKSKGIFMKDNKGMSTHDIGFKLAVFIVAIVACTVRVHMRMNGMSFSDVQIKRRFIAQQVYGTLRKLGNCKWFCSFFLSIAIISLAPTTS
jgi:hypothetical protein